VRSIDDELSRAFASAERQVLATLQCGCHAPVGAYAQCRDGTMELHAFLSDVQGRRIIKRQATGPMSRALQLGERLAAELLDAGGREILRELEREQGTDERGT
jgi:hydroxymethylbilane synthase